MEKPEAGSEIVDLLAIQSGDRLITKDGDIVEAAESSADGIWLVCAYVKMGDGSEPPAGSHPIYGDDLVAWVEST